MSFPERTFYKINLIEQEKIKNMTKIIGLTGGIGSGKSIVTKVFRELKIPIYNSDVEARKLMNNSKNIVVAIKEKFGDDIYLENKKLNKKKLSKAIFKNKNLLNIINSIVHPAVRKHFLEWTKKQTSRYVIKETAILFESGTSEYTDMIITVTAPERLRIRRVKDRDKISIKRIKRIINNQISDKEKINRSDFVIYNDGEQQILPQILKIHKKLIEK